MKPPGYGEAHPRLDDDRMPVVLVVLDGLGDRAIPELGGRTPAEAAVTPVLDALTRRGASGWHLPFGWGAAASSERAHWAMFGFAGVAFPGRAVLEALGAGHEVPQHTTLTYAALRTSQVTDGRLWITGRAAPGDDRDARALLAELGPVFARHHISAHPLGTRGEAILTLPGHRNGDVTDSDPFFEDFHPWLRVMPASPDGAQTARTLNDLLREARACLADSPVNRARRDRLLPALDVLTTKWSGTRTPISSFAERSGVPGALVTSTGLYRGLAAVLGMACRHIPPQADIASDLDGRLAAAEQLIDTERFGFVHVHTKATDEAGHSKQPFAKRDVLSAADPGLARLSGLAERAVVAVTGDHATPSTHGVLHTADPTPLVVAGPAVRPDPVAEFGEAPSRAGWYGIVQAAELLPLLFGHANLPVFLGHRATPQPTLALPSRPEPMPIDSH